MPVLSFGAASIGNLYTPVTDTDARATVDAALAAGVRHFDTAPHYGLGLSERRLGATLTGRADVVISTKVGRLLEPVCGDAAGQDTEGFAVPADAWRVRDYSRDGVLRSLEASLLRLGRDRVDIVLVHDPDRHYRQALDGAFPALEELRSQGVITSYGAGMNEPEPLAEFVRHTDLDVVMLAGRYTLLDQSAADTLLPACAAHGVSVLAAGVFNSGILACTRPDTGARYDYRAAPESLLRRSRDIAAVCARHGVTLPHAAATFPLTHPAVAAACLGMRTTEEVAHDAAWCGRPVPEQLWAELRAEGFLRADLAVRPER